MVGQQREKSGDKGAALVRPFIVLLMFDLVKGTISSNSFINIRTLDLLSDRPFFSNTDPLFWSWR